MNTSDEFFDKAKAVARRLDINMSNDLVYRLRKRAEIRKQISTRKSVQNGEPDRIADLLEEAATEIEVLRKAQDK